MAPRIRKAKKTLDPAPPKTDSSWALNSALSKTSDLDAAMHIAGATMEGLWVTRKEFAKLSEASAIDEKEYRAMNRGARRAFLSNVAKLGIMPRAAVDPKTGGLIEDDNGMIKIVFDPVKPEFRKDCVDMLNRMDGTYVERKEVALAADARLSPSMERLMDSILDTEGVLEI